MVKEETHCIFPACFRRCDNHSSSCKARTSGSPLEVSVASRRHTSQSTKVLYPNVHNSPSKLGIWASGLPFSRSRKETATDIVCSPRSSKGTHNSGLWAPHSSGYSYTAGISSAQSETSSRDTSLTWRKKLLNCESINSQRIKITTILGCSVTPNAPDPTKRRQSSRIIFPMHLKKLPVMSKPSLNGKHRQTLKDVQNSARPNKSFSDATDNGPKLSVDDLRLDQLTILQQDASVSATSDGYEICVLL